MDRNRLEEIRRRYCPKMSEKVNLIYHPNIAELFEYIKELETRLTAREEFEKELMNLINKFR